MTKIAIVYFSASGHTQQVAEAVAEGARSVVGTEVSMLRIVGEDIKDGRWNNDGIIAELNAADGIIFGTPTYMGGYSAQFKAFIDACGGIWYHQGWKDKVGAGFTHSQGLSGDKLNTLAGLVINAMQHSMIWVGTGLMPQGATPEKINRLSSYSGAMSQSNMDQANIGDGDRETAVLLGKRVAETTVRWNR
ncbi:MAG: flavodoxin family protein [Planctomycetota bacterium]|nr:MAG: flavodoxin family protein [Planctomycetota bacterium]